MTTQTSTVTDFILARVADDEAVARWVIEQNAWGPDAPISTGDDPWPSEQAFAEHLAPARVLAQCEAHRAIVELWRQAHDIYGGEAGAFMSDTLRALANIWSDHKDFQADWAL
jgi:hypothetical protein